MKRLKELLLILGVLVVAGASIAAVSYTTFKMSTDSADITGGNGGKLCAIGVNGPAANDVGLILYDSDTLTGVGTNETIWACTIAAGTYFGGRYWLPPLEFDALSVDVSGTNVSYYIDILRHN